MKFSLKALVLPGVAIGIIIWLLVSQVSFEEVWFSISQLSFGQIAFLTILNIFIVFLFSSRWWLILKASGFSVPYLNLVGYRLASFAVSYFTPGTQFGGEPLQVHLLNKKNHIPSPIALASVALDKLLELIVNFAFISLGLLTIITNSTKLAGSSSQGWLSGLDATQAIAWIVGSIGLPMTYLFLLWRGRFPLAQMSRKLPAFILRMRLFHNLPAFLASTERQISTLFRVSPRTIGMSSLLSLVIWVFMALEFWIMIDFLGANLSLIHLITILTAARLAFLMPLPGSAGVLEASQVLTMQALGFNPALGLSISFLIRARDISLGLVGLWLGVILTKKKPYATQDAVQVEVNPGVPSSYPLKTLKEV